MTPKRIQRKRTKGWKMPENTVYVGRPTVWGNPYEVEQWGDGWHIVSVNNHVHMDYGKDATKREATETAVRYFQEMALTLSWKHKLEMLRGKDLACWCKEGEPCHADVLLRLANS